MGENESVTFFPIVFKVTHLHTSTIHFSMCHFKKKLKKCNAFIRAHSYTSCFSL